MASRVGSRNSPLTRPTLTSDDSPLRVAFLPLELHGSRGTLGLTFAPGKKHQGLEALWNRDLSTDLRRLREVYGTDLLVSLIEDSELTLLHIEDLYARARHFGIDTLRLQIQDGSVPRSLPMLASLVKQVATALERGRNVVVHCRGGLGRAGLVTAAILIGHGLDARRAMAEIRKTRPGAIENRLQEEFVERFASEWTALRSASGADECGA